MITVRVVITLAALMLGGCASIAGIGGSSKLSCPMPDGTSCKSISETYSDPVKPAKSTINTVEKNADAVIPAIAAPPILARSATPVSGSSLPLRSAPRVLRLWIAPFEDLDGDLFEEMRVYLHLDAGAWNIEHRKELATRRFAPLRAPVVTGAAESATPSPRAQPGTGPTLSETQGLTKPVMRDNTDQQ
jgi:conjugal transfer pilus assembly protein TraV